MKVIDGMKRARSLNGLISIVIAQRKLDKLRLDFLAGLKSRAVANDYQIAFAQAGKDFVFVRRFQAKFD
jgi:hypothetical protein